MYGYLTQRFEIRQLIVVPGDQNTEKCKRCESKGLECVRTSARAFRHGSSAKYDAQFSGTQSWVNSSAKECKCFSELTLS